jgi:hypothetical protein
MKREIKKKIYLEKEGKYYYQGWIKYIENNQIVIHFDCNKFQDKERGIIDLSQLHYTLHNANPPKYPKTIGHFRTYNWEGEITNSLADTKFNWNFKDFSHESFNFLTMTLNLNKEFLNFGKNSIVFNTKSLNLDEINIHFILTSKKMPFDQTKTFLIDDFYPILKIEIKTI